MHIGESSSSVTSRWAAVLWVASYKQSWQSQYMWQQEILATVAYSLIGCSVKCLRDERAYIQVPHWDFGSSIYLVIGQALGRSNQSWMRRTKSSLFSLSLSFRQMADLRVLSERSKSTLIAISLPVLSPYRKDSDFGGYVLIWPYLYSLFSFVKCFNMYLE